MVREGKKLVDNNPVVDVAAFLFLEDIADKQGEAGMNNYLMSLAASLAKTMPEEEYDDWEAFQEAMKNGESSLSVFEDIINPTQFCFVTKICPYERGITEYRRRIGELAPQHYNVAEYYNNTIKPGALDTCCVIHQTFRKFASERIKVGGGPIRYAQISNMSVEGRHKRAPEEWLPILLEKAMLSSTKLNMLQRSNACIWLIYPEITVKTMAAAKAAEILIGD